MNGDKFPGDVVEAAGRLSLNDLPDELLILIFNRLMDLKCLCLCSLVSPRFSSLILLHVHSVHFAVPHRITTTTTDVIPTPDNPATDNLAQKTLRFFAKPLEYFRQFVTPKPLPSLDFSFDIDSICYPFSFLRKFKCIRSLHMLFPSSAHNRTPNDHSLIFKCTAKSGPNIDTFVFLSTSSIRDVEQEQEQEEEEDPVWIIQLIRDLGFKIECYGEAVVWYWMLRFFIREHPLLKNITTTASENRVSLSLRGSKDMEIGNWMRERIPVLVVSVQQWHVPVLKLPVSRKVMVGATLLLMETVVRPDQGSRDWGDDAADISTLFSTQGEEEFAEAIVEMLVTHKNSITTLV